MNASSLFRLITLLAFGTLVPSAVQADSGEFVFLLKGRGNIFWKVIREGVQETASKKGLSAVILHTDDDQTPEAQLNMCLTSISRKPKVIVLGAATKNVGIECFKKASAAGILVADIDGNVTVDDAKEAGVPLAFSIASDNLLIGKAAAEYLVASTAKKDPKVLVIKGLNGSIVSDKRASGFIARLKELLPQAQIVGTPAADWDRMKAMNTSLDYMQRVSDLDFIFSVSDVMTTGVVEAVKVGKKEGSCKILSVDGIADAKKAILAGKILADVAQLPYLMGKRAVELAEKTSLEAMSYYSEFTPTPVLTKAVLEMNADPDLDYLR